MPVETSLIQINFGDDGTVPFGRSRWTSTRRGLHCPAKQLGARCRFDQICNQRAVTAAMSASHRHLAGPTVKRAATWLFYAVGAIAIGYLALYLYAMLTAPDLKPGEPIRIFRKQDAPEYS
jgi:hypothetical protein